MCKKKKEIYIIKPISKLFQSVFDACSWMLKVTLTKVFLNFKGGDCNSWPRKAGQCMSREDDNKQCKDYSHNAPIICKHVPTYVEG